MSFPRWQRLWSRTKRSDAVRRFRLQVEQLEYRLVPSTSQSIHDLYVFRSPGDPQPPNPDAVNFGNTVLALTIGEFAGVQTPITFDPTQTYDLNVINTAGHLTPDFTFRATFAVPVPGGPPGVFDQVVTLRLIQGNTT